jgi:hypothetical protein
VPNQTKNGSAIKELNTEKPMAFMIGLNVGLNCKRNIIETGNSVKSHGIDEGENGTTLK